MKSSFEDSPKALCYAINISNPDLFVKQKLYHFFRTSLIPLHVRYASFFNMKNFDKWNEVKNNLEESDGAYSFPKEGEVWMMYCGLNVGSEQNGAGERFSRPALILKKINNAMFWIVPLSTKQKEIDYYFNFTDVNELQVSVILAQLKLVSIKRLSRKMYQMKSDLFTCIKYKIIKML